MKKIVLVIALLLLTSTVFASDVYERGIKRITPWNHYVSSPTYAFSAYYTAQDTTTTRAYISVFTSSASFRYISDTSTTTFETDFSAAGYSTLTLLCSSVTANSDWTLTINESAYEDEDLDRLTTTTGVLDSANDTTTYNSQIDTITVTGTMYVTFQYITGMQYTKAAGTSRKKHFIEGGSINSTFALGAPYFQALDGTTVMTKEPLTTTNTAYPLNIENGAIEGTSATTMKFEIRNSTAITGGYFNVHGYTK